MEHYEFRYAGIGHSIAGGPVVFKLERKDGGQLGVLLTADDAAQLLDDLRDQVRIAKSDIASSPSGDRPLRR